MLKQRIILSFLLFAFAVVLTHSIVPHHHHKSEIEARNHQDDEPLEQSFEFYKHASNTGDCFLLASNDYSFQVAESSELFRFDFKLPASNVKTDLAKPCFQSRLILSHYCVSSLSFRGPPQA